MTTNNLVVMVIELAVVLFLIVQPIAFPWLGLRIEAWGAAIQILGLAFIVGGLALNLWARLHLGAFFSERISIQIEHQLVDSGPYAYIRHPIYTALFCAALGVLLINPALVSVLMISIVVTYLVWLIPQEEQFLTKALPGYAEYMARTPRFLPRLHKWLKEK